MKVLYQNPKSQVWYVVALEAEFYNKDVNILYTGVGLVDAAMSVQWLLDHHKVSKIINLGTCACRDGLHGITVRPAVVELRDGWDGESQDAYDINIEGGGMILASGNSFVKDWKKLDKEIKLVDMEAWAICRVCDKNGIDCDIVKYISDSGDEVEWEKSLKEANKTFNKMVKKHINE